MKINSKAAKGVKVEGVAGVGPGAWNRPDPPPEVASTHHHHHKHHIVKVDHEERTKELSEHPHPAAHIPGAKDSAEHPDEKEKHSILDPIAKVLHHKHDE